MMQTGRTGGTEGVLADIESKDDIAVFMRHFYHRLLKDPVAAPVFAGIDMEAHLPKVEAFWGDMVFGGGQYRGSPFDPHVPLDLKPEHFNVWFSTFCSCLDELHEGPRVTQLKDRARSIAAVFSHKLGLDPPTF